MRTKDYKLLATAINKFDDCFASEEKRLSFVAELGLMIARDNPNFDYSLFKEACLKTPV